MNWMSLVRPIFVGLAVVLANAPLAAQETLLREDQITRSGLIDQLAPAAEAARAAAASSGPESRGFQPRRRPVVAASGATPGRASLLITFVTDSAALTERDRSALDVVASAMKSERLAAVTFRIEGHADARGDDEHNLRLSQARAESVRAYLLHAEAADPERLVAVGKGASEPLRPEDPAAAENRRVTIVALP